MRVWVDADACPRAIKEIVMKAAERMKVETVFVANKDLLLPESPYLIFAQVEPTLDAADLYIQERAVLGDLVITQDIPLAAVLVPAGVEVIDTRGSKFSPDDVGERLSIRNFLKELRDGGEITGGPKQFSDRDKRAFAATFDKELSRLVKRNGSP